MSYKITHDATLSPSTASTKIQFLESFYATSDTESKHEEYVENFTPDATLIMGPKMANGSDGISFPPSSLSLPHYLSIHICTKEGRQVLMVYRNPHPPPRSLDTCRSPETFSREGIFRGRE